MGRNETLFWDSIEKKKKKFSELDIKFRSRIEETMFWEEDVNGAKATPISPKAILNMGVVRYFLPVSCLMYKKQQLF